MPFVSKSQQRFMFAKHPAMAKRWADHTPDIKSLPERKSTEDTKSKEASVNSIAQLAIEAAERPYIEKFASDAKVSSAIVRELARVSGLSPVAFCKAAYAEPQAFNELLKEAALGRMGFGAGESGAVPGVEPVKQNRNARRAAEPVVRNQPVPPTPPPAPGPGPSLAGPKLPSIDAGHVPDALGLGNKGPGVLSKVLGALRKRALPIGVGALGVAGLARGASSLMGGGGKSGPDAGGGASPSGPAAPASSPAMPKASPEGPKPSPSMGGSPPQAAGGPAGAGGMSPLAKALLLGGGVAAGGYGLSRLMGGGKKKRKEVEASDKQPFMLRAMQRAAMTKAASIQQRQARTVMTSYLEKVASNLPVERQHGVRSMQLSLSQGKPLSYAIKLAYPTLSGEQRGLLASKLVKSAVAGTKKANAGFNTIEPMSQSGPASDMGKMMGKVGC